MDIRHVCLRAVIVFCLVSQGASKSLDVVWLSPPVGAVFNPGDTIIAKWTSSSVLISPDFKLCTVSGDMRRISSGDLMDRGGEKEGGAGESENCGVAIWPQVKQTEDGYMAAMYVSYILNPMTQFTNVIQNCPRGYYHKPVLSEDTG